MTRICGQIVISLVISIHQGVIHSTISAPLITLMILMILKILTDLTVVIADDIAIGFAPLTCSRRWAFFGGAINLCAP